MGILFKKIGCKIGCSGLEDQSLFGGTHHGRIDAIVGQLAAHPVHCLQLRERPQPHPVQRALVRLPLGDLRLEAEQRQLGARAVGVGLGTEGASLQIINPLAVVRLGVVRLLRLVQDRILDDRRPVVRRLRGCSAAPATGAGAASNGIRRAVAGRYRACRTAAGWGRLIWPAAVSGGSGRACLLTNGIGVFMIITATTTAIPRPMIRPRISPRKVPPACLCL